MTVMMKMKARPAMKVKNGATLSVRLFTDLFV